MITNLFLYLVTAPLLLTYMEYDAFKNVWLKRHISFENFLKLRRAQKLTDLIISKLNTACRNIIG